MSSSKYLFSIIMSIAVGATATHTPTFMFSNNTQLVINQTIAYIDQNVLNLTQQNFTAMLNELSYYARINQIDELAVLNALNDHCAKKAAENINWCSTITRSRLMTWPVILTGLYSNRNTINAIVSNACKTLEDTHISFSSTMPLLKCGIASIVGTLTIVYEVETQKKYRQYALLAEQYNMINDLLVKEKHVLPRAQALAQLPQWS